MAGAISGSFKDRVFDAHQYMERQSRTQVTKSQVAREVTKVLQESGDLPNGKKIKQNVVTKWYDGVVPETLEKIAALAQVFGVRAGWLAFGEGEMRAGEGAEERRPRVTRAEVDRRKRMVDDAETGEDDRVG